VKVCCFIETYKFFEIILIFLAWALKRGFFTAKASRPDVYRSANHILRLALDGRINLCLRPPGFNADKGSFFSYMI
jgi:hypothetical protein